MNGPRIHSTLALAVLLVACDQDVDRGGSPDGPGIEFDVARDAGAEAYSNAGGEWDRGSFRIGGATQEVDYERIDGHAIMEADIVLAELDQSDVISAQGVVTNYMPTWPTNVVAYEFLNEPSEERLDQFLEGAAMWEDAIPGLEFVEHTDERDYLLIDDTRGCSSYVGRVRDEGPQELWLSSSCTAGAVAHELGHVFGLLHEHSRADRDDYVIYNEENVQDGRQPNFNKLENHYYNAGRYNVESIMHYGPWAFSKNGGETLTGIDIEGKNMGQRVRLELSDIMAVEFMLLRRDADPAGWVDVLEPGEKLLPGARFTAGDARLEFSEDGNLSVIHEGRMGDTLLWQSDTAGLGVTHLHSNGERQIEMVDEAGEVVWSTPFGAYGRLEFSGLAGGTLGVFRENAKGELAWVSTYDR